MEIPVVPNRLYWILPYNARWGAGRPIHMEKGKGTDSAGKTW